MDFGIFVCSTCSGIHREMTHKVKGIAMCNFNDKEIEILTKNGNEVTLNHFLSTICRMFRSLWWLAIAKSYTPSLTRRTRSRWRNFSIWSTSKEDSRRETIKIVTKTVTLTMIRKRRKRSHLRRRKRKRSNKSLRRRAMMKQQRRNSKKRKEES